MNLKKYLGIVFIIGAIIPTFALAANGFKYVRDEGGAILGATYKLADSEISGQLAVDNIDSRLLFVECESQLVLDNEKHILRTSRNCAGEFSVWPPLLLTYITKSLGTVVPLGGPPSTCGACTKVPYAEFELPENTPIDPRIHIIVIESSPPMFKSVIENARRYDEIERIDDRRNIIFEMPADIDALRDMRTFPGGGSPGRF